MVMDAASNRPKRKLFRPALWVALAMALPLCGCNYVVLLGYLIGGPPSIEPDFDMRTNKSMTDKDVTVAVVCYAPSEVRADFHAIDSEIARYVTHRLNQKKIKVFNSDSINAWLDENSDWDRPEEIGHAFGATYVIYIDIEKFSLYAEHSAVLYQGRSEGMVKVYEMYEDGDGDLIYSSELISKYPLLAPRDTREVTFARFKREYLSRLSEEIGRKFYEYYNGDDISDAT